MIPPVSARTPSPAPQLLSKQESRLEGGRNQVTQLYESEAGSRVVHDRVRGYTYSFHPVGVVHLYPTCHEPRRQATLTIFEAPANETSGYDNHLAFLGLALTDLGLVDRGFGLLVAR